MLEDADSPITFFSEGGLLISKLFTYVMNRYRSGRSREREKVVLCEGMGRE